MAKHASPSAHLQVVESPKSVAVQIPLPVLGALVDGNRFTQRRTSGSLQSRLEQAETSFRSFRY